ncbi:hypothetical protein K493DRAFT_313874 [Basidiobolus meristosporus CBS 931.73]|uniref:Arrestin C-terminal-like domain-containing protein n=1 Tax=Basidiobolus meristosporus CBS 931.73 TaxID=1314790 RepID=A0A1Y1YK00_9FUNG|nr:hypothetical protein K493DRAFT_313874 [Basidiobolus meristosporus CBS 931.73]|eukprot:ORX97924.1 hypothetical protein K493DRAFT_313874 [Basidiobolus meristosporus CBS 931.73]
MFNLPHVDSTTQLATEHIQIDLNGDSLTMYGTTEESVGCVLRGTLRFNPQEHMKVKSIHLKFVGKVKINGGFDLPRHEYDVIRHKWTFLEARRDAYLLAPKDYAYDFELPLKGDLPESIDVNSGKIVYKLVATVERPAFHFDMKACRTVEIKRAPLPSSDDYLQPTMIHGVWLDKFAYQISSPETTYTVGDQFPVLYSFCSFEPTFKIRKISLVLREFISYSLKGGKPIIKCHDLSQASQVCNEHAWEGSLNLQIPKGAYCDSECSYIKVVHKVFVEIETEDGNERKTLHLLLRVGVQSDLQNELSQCPPSYEAMSPYQGIPPPPYAPFNNTICA